MKKAPTFELQSIDGRFHHLEDFRGKHVILTFWASWCPDSARDLPKKEQLYDSMDHDNVEMITINVVGRERDEQAGITYANKYLSQLTLLDDGRKTYDVYQCQGVPTTVLINKQGELVEQFGDKANMMDIVQAIGNKLL
ncbi:TlpA family protein disulfide reductase [Pontibacillus salicampi]|uniref:TlpA family protein disulfide reductase n=1 Tax=Pontibacillus salicampi TaxID=1449801 RepID=A0ABV6LNM0_9BACI